MRTAVMTQKDLGFLVIKYLKWKQQDVDEDENFQVKTFELPILAFNDFLELLADALKDCKRLKKEEAKIERCYN